jgi:hypothetical protein
MNKIIHVWSGEARDEATAQRMAMAKITWERERAAYGGWLSIQHEVSPSQNATLVGDPVALPFIHDMVNDASRLCEDGSDIILITNADIGLFRGFATELAAKVSASGAVFCHRWDFPALAEPLQTKAGIKTGKKYPGMDAFGFSRRWWLENRDDIPPFILGRECWDWILREKIKETGGTEMQSAIFHIAHNSDWKKGRAKHPGNIYNRSYARAWLMKRKMDLREIANAPYNEVAWPPVQFAKRQAPKPAGSVDVLYVIGRGSKWDNQELRYSLRSLEKYACGVGNVFVVGHVPVFLSDKVTTLQREDFGKNKEHNIAEQIEFAAANLSLSERFLWVNDDCFFTQETDITGYPYYSDGSLEAKWRSTAMNGYRVALAQADAQLRARGFPTHNFENHVPIIYTRAGMAKMAPWVRLSGRMPYGMTFRSVYCNALGIPPGPQYRDLKIGNCSTPAELEARIKGRHVFSIGDGFSDAAKAHFDVLYPERSSYEK